MLFKPGFLHSTITMATSMALPIAFSFLALFFPFQYVVADYILYSGQALMPGQNLTYDLRPHGLPFDPQEFALHQDCNAVRYENYEATWATNTSRSKGLNCYLSVLHDGEIVLRDNFHYPVWRSGSKSAPGEYAFVLQWNGALGAHGPVLWSSSNDITLSDPNPMVSTHDYLVYAGQITPVSYGIVLTYKNFQLRLRNDCNLILNDTATGSTLWQTNSYSPYNDCFVLVDHFGELLVKHRRREILWRSGVRLPKPSSPVLLLRYDGRIAVYSEQIWYVPAVHPFIPPGMSVGQRFARPGMSG